MQKTFQRFLAVPVLTITVMTMLPIPKMETQFGKLYETDCLSVLPHLSSGSVDLIFADPPFNLGKEYNAKFTDSVPERDYLSWCERWLNELIRLLCPGGAFFLRVSFRGSAV